MSDVDSVTKMNSRNPIVLSEESLQQALDQAVVDHDVVGASLAIGHRNHTYSVASGILNSATGAQVTIDSPFQIGSITKVMTATLVMQLVEQGQVDLDQPVRTGLPELSRADPSAVPAITLRHLLSHSAGLNGEPHPVDTDESPKLAAFLQNNLNPATCFVAPGTMHSYSNESFVIAGRLIEVMTGQDWDTVLAERIFKPLGLSSAFTSPPTPCPSTAAVGHVADAEHPGHHSVVIDEPARRCMAPAGATCYMSASDLLRFVEESDCLLSGESLRIMRTPQVTLHPYSPRNTTHWGFGWSLVDYPAHQILSHDGTTPGQASYLRVLPDVDFAIALLTNSASAPLWEDLWRRLLRDLMQLELPVHERAGEFHGDPARYVGVYEVTGGRVDVTYNSNLLHVTMSDGRGGPTVLAGELLPFATDAFEFRMPNGDMLSELSFIGQDESGRAQFLSFGFRAVPRQRAEAPRDNQEEPK